MITGDISRLALGTAQFGLPYGIASGRTQVTISDVSAILQLASCSGFRVLDTAASYGDSEIVLGNSKATKQFRLISKTLPIREAVLSDEKLDSIKMAFDLTLKRLNRSHLDVLLVHDIQDLLAPGGSGLWSWMQEIKKAGLVLRIGISAYDSTSARLLFNDYSYDVVQIPFNLLDHRIANDGFLEFCSRNSIAVHARSVFLQGLLLMPPPSLPVPLRGLLPYLTKLKTFSESLNVSPHTFALAFVARRPEIEQIIVGVHDASQLAHLIAVWSNLADFTDHDIDWAGFHCSDINLIDPRFWKH